jgi:hypothetical protein
MAIKNLLFGPNIQKADQRRLKNNEPLLKEEVHDNTWLASHLPESILPELAPTSAISFSDQVFSQQLHS